MSFSRNCLLSRKTVLSPGDLRPDPNWDVFEYVDDGTTNCKKTITGGFGGGGGGVEEGTVGSNGIEGLHKTW